jgi:hypothetical protein
MIFLSAYWPLTANFVDIASGYNGATEHVSIIDGMRHISMGGSLILDRSRIVLPNVPINVAEFTVEALVKVDPEFAPAGDTKSGHHHQDQWEFQRPQCRPPTDSWPPAPFPFNMSLGYSGGQLRLTVGLGDGNPWGTQYKSGIIGVPGDWIHLMVTADRDADELLWYVNGQSVSTPQTPQRLNYNNMIDSVRNVIIGDKGKPDSSASELAGYLAIQRDG